MRLYAPVVLAICALLSTKCGDTVIQNVLPTSPTPTVTTNHIEFRVTGNLPSARIRYSNTTDGLNQIVTGLPFFSAMDTHLGSMFLSLEVTPLIPVIIPLNPFMTGQIIVNDALFQQGATTDTTTVLLISGQWRK